MKFRNNLFKTNVISSICIAGIFLAFILILNFVFDLFKVWTWSIQMFLVVYALGIYKIKNLIVNFFFLLIVPPLLFVTESGAYVINGTQVFIEYFLVFYIFCLLYLSSFIACLFKNKKIFKIIDIFIFTISFIIILIIKFLLHSLASLVWWGSKDFVAALAFNSMWLAANTFTIPIAIAISPIVFKLFDKVELDTKNKWNY